MEDEYNFLIGVVDKKGQMIKWAIICLAEVKRTEKNCMTLQRKHRHNIKIRKQVKSIY